MATKRKAKAGDRSKRVRTFEVWIDKGFPGQDRITETVEVPAGEDADEWCADALDTLISNEIDSGWREIEIDSSTMKGGG